MGADPVSKSTPAAGAGVTPHAARSETFSFNRYANGVRVWVCVGAVITALRRGPRRGRVRVWVCVGAVITLGAHAVGVAVKRLR